MRVTTIFGVLAAGLTMLATPSAHAVGPGIGIGDGIVCNVFAASPTAQAGLGRVVGTGYIACPTSSAEKPILYTLTVCAQRADFFRPTQIMWLNGDTCTRKSGGIDNPAWAEALDDSVPCGSIPLYRTYAYATIAGIPGIIEGTSEERPSACI